MIETKSMKEYQKECAAHDKRYNMDKSLSVRMAMDDKILGKHTEKPVKKRVIKRPHVTEEIYNYMMNKGKGEDFQDSVDKTIKLDFENTRARFDAEHHADWLMSEIGFHKALHWISGIVITLLLCVIGMLY